MKAIKTICIVSLFLIMSFMFTGCEKATEKVNNVETSSTLESSSEPKSIAENDNQSKDFKESPLIANDTGKTIISKANFDRMYNTSYMIISKDGTVVLADPIQVLDGIEADIITVTHGHSDHFDGSAKEKEDCKKSISKIENFTHKDIKVTSIASSHTDNEINMDFPTNIIYIFEVDGLRIAHMGDIGQDTLTDEQLKSIGELDVAIIPCMDLPQYGLTIEKSIKIIKQLNPRIVIPGHYDPTNIDVYQKISESFDEVQNKNFKFELSKDDMENINNQFIVLK